jgi:succinate dehydrogenase/fumarate reductase cytochrome b subunit
MNTTLAKALLAFVPTSILLIGSMVMFSRRKIVSSFLQMLGAAGLVLVALVHVCEALHVFLWMRWGLQNSAGHYLDLAGLLVGITLFPIGYLAFAVSRRTS